MDTQHNSQGCASRLCRSQQRKMRSRSARWFAWLTATTLGGSLLTSLAHADEPVVAFESPSRFDQLAADLPVALPPAPLNVDSHVVPVAHEFAAEGLDKEAVEQIVAGYLKDQEKKKKDDAKKAKEEGYVVGSDKKMTAVWNNGIEFQSENKDFRFHIGGRTQIDAVYLTASDSFNAGLGGVNTQDAVDFRRARLRADARLWEIYDFVVEFDFVNGQNVDPTTPGTQANTMNSTVPVEIWTNISQLPVVGNFRMGLFKEPMGLEHQQSSRFLDFMERSYLQDAYTGPFNNGFSPGFMIFDNYAEERGTWAIAAVRNITTGYQYGIGDGENALTARLTYLPIWDDESEGRYMMHIAGWASTRDTDNSQLRIRSRGSLRNSLLTPNLADTGTLFADRQDMAGVEWAWNNGPLLLQAEYMASNAQDVFLPNGPGSSRGTSLGNMLTQGYYVEALYFLTGEHREYERKEARFGRVKPHENFFLVRTSNCNTCGGTGAWQVGARYNYLDLSDAGLPGTVGLGGGIIKDVTLGVNWFLNPNMKLQFNYVWTHRDMPVSAVDRNGDMHGFGTRFAMDF